MNDLSILIPSRNEMFLKNTIEDALKNIEADTEIIAVLDGVWTDPPIEQNERVNVIYVHEAIGQRIATNLACKLSKAKYVMKIDAHCSFDKGFDRKMIVEMKDHYTMAPVMKNLHAFDWKCYRCGWKKYQGPKPERCEQCNDSRYIRRKMIWKGKPSPNSTAYRITKELEFKYWGDYKKRQVGDIVDTLSLQGSCFMCTRQKYWELGLCDESWGSWGGQGAEVALKTWLSGGEVKVNKKTWYAHMFRTQGKDFGFPYDNPGREQKKTKDTLRNIFLNDKWPKQKYPLSWLVERFWPIPDWEQKDLDKLKEK